MLILARESRGITQKDLADAVGATQGHLSKLEAGAIQPSAEMLQRLSDALHYPPGFFSQPERVYGPSVSEFFHRKRANVSVRVLSRIHAQLNIRRIQVARLLRSADVDQRLPRHDLEEFAGNVEEVARAVRASWRVPRGPIRSVIETIENAGGVVVRMRFDTTKVDAISHWVPGSLPLLAVNDSLPSDRERMSLCHELGHLVMHDQVRPQMEDEANAFAGAFLMPADEIRSHLADLSLHKLAGLKTHWRVSMQALLMRAEHLGAVSTGKAKYLWSQISRAGYRTREPAELDFPKEEPGLVQELIELHTATLGYDADQLGNLLNLFGDELHATYAARGLPRPPAALRVLK